MFIPKDVPECTTLKYGFILSFFYVICQIVSVICVYNIYFVVEKPFMLVLVNIYSVIGIYGCGFILDNSPLLGVSGIFTTYLLCCMLINELFLWSLFFILCFFVIVSAVIKDQYSHYIFPQKPIIINIWLYLLLNVFPYVIPFHICNQNIYYKNNIVGFQML